MEENEIEKGNDRTKTDFTNIVAVNCLHAECPTCGSKVDVYPSIGTFVVLTPPQTPLSHPSSDEK